MDQYVNQVSIRHLRYFVAIVRNGSFRRAAEELSISQPPLTRQIQQLEEILGAPLLERGPSGVKPTEAGQSFFTEAQNIMGLIERACSNVSLIGAGQLGQLDVGVFGSAVLDFVPRVVLHFRNRFPNVEVVLHNMDRETQIKALKERRIQIGFNRFFLNYPDLIWERVLHEKLLVAIPSDHPLTNKKVVSLRDLASEPLIFYPRTDQPGGFSNHLIKAFQYLSVDAHVVQNVDDVVTAVAFVSSGLGLTICVNSVKNLRLPGVTYLPLVEGDIAEIDLSVIYRAIDKSQLLNTFLESIKTAASTL